MWLPRLTGVALVAVCVTLFLAPTLAQDPYTGFIRVSNGRFVDADCKEFLFSGWNGWKLLDYASNKVTPPGFGSGREFIQDLFQRAQGSGLNMLRFFTTGDDSNEAVLLSGPGQFNEYALGALDFILDEAAKAGIKLVVVPLNLWKQNNGVPQWEEWCGTDALTTSPRPDLEMRPLPLNESERLQTPYDWYISPQCRQMFKDYLAALVNRVNSINGVRYRDDPVIFAWNMMNEPRCKYCGPQPVNDWYHDIAAFLKSVDPNHMVTTGEEGFFDDTSPFSAYNPNNGNLWGGRTGQDFSLNHDSPSIDFAVMHLWPDNWRNPPLDLTFGRAWIQAHIQAAERIGKPLVLEEFGKNAREGEISTIRDPWFDLVNSMVESSLASNGVLRGALFWQWDGYGSQPRTDGGSNIRETDSTFVEHIEPFADRIAEVAAARHRVAGGVVDGCVPQTFSGATPLATNSSSAASAPPTGAGGSPPSQEETLAAALENLVASTAGRKLLKM